MTDLLAARSQMAMSLGFHIIFAVIGIAMPVQMLIAEALYRYTGDEIYLTLGRRWASGAAILFAVGAGLGYRALVRIGPALAALHAMGGADHRDALFARGLRLFH